MTPTKATTLAQRAVLPLAVLLFLDLCLDWHRASVSLVGSLDVHADASALAGWGLLAAIAAGGLIAWEARRTFGSKEVEDGEVLSAALGVATLAFTAIEFFSGSTTVVVGGMMNVSAGTRLWPAYVGLALAAVLAVCTIAQLARPIRTDGRGLHARPS
jgi:hypothetical protein